MVTLCTTRLNIKQGRQCTYDVTLRRVDGTTFVVEKQQVLHIGLCVYLCTCVCECGCTGAGVWPYLSNMQRACSLLSASSLAPPRFLTSSHKRCDFRGGKKLLNVKCAFFTSYTTFIRNISHFKNKSARYCHKCEKPSCNVPVILLDFHETRIFWIRRFTQRCSWSFHSYWIWRLITG